MTKKMELERAQAIGLLRKLVEGWKSIPEDALVPEEINDGRFEEAEEFLRKVGAPK
jgi:hypothetical protein